MTKDDKETINVTSRDQLEIIADNIVKEIFKDPKTHDANVLKLTIMAAKRPPFNTQPLPGCLKGPDYAHRYQHCPYCNWINCYDCHGLKPTPVCKERADLIVKRQNEITAKQWEEYNKK